VNDTTEQLKKLFTRAKAWGVHFTREPIWRDHWRKEPQERVRELRDDEAERLAGAMREDYAPFFAFAHASGLRLRECLLRWSEVGWRVGQIIRPGKAGGEGRAPSPHLSRCQDRVATTAQARQGERFSLS
jgi:hypothetical protein